MAEPVFQPPKPPGPPPPPQGLDVFTPPTDGALPPAAPASEPPSSLGEVGVTPAPVLREVEGNQTVQGQLENIYTSSDSPLMEQARQNALSSADSRGLRNTSLATQAGEQAVIGQSVNIATQDALAHQRAAEQNQNVQNQFGLQEQVFGHQTSLAEQRIGHELTLADRVQEHRVELSTLDHTQLMTRATQVFDHQSALSTQAFDQAGDLSEQAFTQAIDLSVQDFNEQSSIVAQEFANALGLSEADHQELLDQMQFDQTNVLGRIVEQAAQDRISSAVDFEEARQLDTLRNQLDLVRIAAQSDASLNEIAAQIEGRITEIEEQARQNIILSELDSDEALELESLRGELDIARIEAQGDENQALEVTRLENRITEIEEQALAQNSVNAEADSRRLQLQYLSETGAVMRQAMGDIATVNTTEGLTSSQQMAAVSDIRRQMSTDLAALRAFYEDVPGWQPNWGVDPSPSDPAPAVPGPLPGAPTPPPTIPSPPGESPAGPPRGPVPTPGGPGWDEYIRNIVGGGDFVSEGLRNIF